MVLHGDEDASVTIVWCLQSSLLGLLLASRFFGDPLICLPCGISVIVMTLVSLLAVVLCCRLLVTSHKHAGVCRVYVCDDVPLCCRVALPLCCFGRAKVCNPHFKHDLISAGQDASVDDVSCSLAQLSWWNRP